MPQLPIDTAQDLKVESESDKKQDEENHSKAGLHEEPPLVPSILPLVTKEIRDDYSRLVEIRNEITAKKSLKSVPNGPDYRWGVPALMCTLLIFFAIGVVAYAIFIHRSPNNAKDLVRPPYYSLSPTPVPN